MPRLHLALAACLFLTVAGAVHAGTPVLPSASTSAPTVTSPSPARMVMIRLSFKKRTWRRGDLATLRFTSTSTFAGVGPGNVMAFVYVSDVPDPFNNPLQDPIFVGDLPLPIDVNVPIYLEPERNPITEFTRERFVQGAAFDSVTGELLGVSEVEYLDIEYSSKPDSFDIDFETEDDFTTPLVNGQDISTPPEFGTLFDVLSTGVHLGPAIFDTDPAGPNAFGADPDLLVGLGNALILQGFPGQTVPGIFDIPNDVATGGTFIFDFGEFEFTRHVRPKALDLIDMCLLASNSATITLRDVLGHERIFTVPPGWTTEVTTEGPPGFGTLDLTSLSPQVGFMSTATAIEDDGFLDGEVVRMEVELSGSGAIDNFRFDREADPVPIPLPRLRARLR